MPKVEAFCGIRYSSQAGSLKDLVAPPYDVIDTELLNKLQSANPKNVVRLILPQPKEGDSEPGSDGENRYSRSADLLKEWKVEGTLVEESSAAIYVYHQRFSEAGVDYTRRGFMCRVRLERFGEGQVFPHEETHGGAKADRLNLWRACKANLSQIFGLYADESNQVQELLEKQIAGTDPLEATDHLGVVNQIWPLTDSVTIQEVKQLLDGQAVYIADGHHRYETACDYRDEIAAAHGGELPEDHPANFVLMMCVSTSDPGMIVLPTHRLFRNMPSMSADQLAVKLGDAFDTQIVSEGPQSALEVWQRIEAKNDQGTMAFYTAKDQQWTLCHVTNAGKEMMSKVSPDRSSDWQSLGVSLLHHLVMDELLQAPETAAPKYVRSIEEVVVGLTQGDDSGRDLTGQVGTGAQFELAALVMPASLEDIRNVSNHGERMPAKSTYFYPKVLSGLVINPLE